MEILRDKEFITQLTSRAKKGEKKEYDTILARFQDCPKYRASQIAMELHEEFCARYDAIGKKTIRTWPQQKSVKDVKTIGYWYSTAKGKTVR